MKHKYSIIIIHPDHDKAPRQIQFSVKAKKMVVISSAALVIFFTGLFAHDIYQAYYINIYQQKIAYVDKLEAQLQTKDLEIARLNEKTSEINQNLLTISSLESKIAGILKIQQKNTTEVSRGSYSVQSYSEPESLDQASNLLNSHVETLQEYYDASVEYKDKLNRTPSILPVNGPISSPFGYRRNPFGGWSSEFHSGVDIACDYGTPVQAVAAGTVTYAGYDGYWGRRVQIDHGYGVVTFYAHNSKLTVKVGDTIQKGDVVAYSGNSGRSTGSHLHYQAYIDGELVDPTIFTTYTETQ
ncbi:MULTISPECIES: M23 family metallopeptidase [unclassified Dehalobacter]|uniref:M23 family metallopeptidase n=1 Tax=unclassified Dehalobacter TaxID=2635733 RepID=UPI000E6C38D6|nr:MULTISPECIES: M23 family metallopeptidase [unclassified Dehalobacter]RJE48334.1 metalloendopeptidase [Dehalobacter sp. MCB1]TCX50403.1 metalloendopeptidase [Dehalobacter sp. 14DCB1]TCX52357.1 metalloendopeptidase [Dehalobacter sp. 12DCB1]